MNLFETDVDYFSSVTDEQTEIKRAVWSDGELEDLISEFGMCEVLYRVTSLQFSVGQQLSDRSAAGYDRSNEWYNRALNLSIQLKKRRQQLRKAVRLRFGEDELNKIRVRAQLELAD